MSIEGLQKQQHQQLGPVITIIAALAVFLLSLITVGCNSIILAAFYRYKRLRTASNCLLVSLAISDFGVGVFMPLGTYLELVDLPELKNVDGKTKKIDNISSQLCVLPYCVVIALCSVSVLVTVAIAVDRLTSLAQPLRYKNIITHSSIEKYIAVFWIYATIVGLSPLIYPKIAGYENVQTSFSSEISSCRFNGAILPPVRVFLFLAVWAPSAFILLGCYVYVYLVARAHARAIYTVELSFRNQTQTLALPRYGQTLAVTVGAFFVLWLPFQTCMLLDTFLGTNILSDCTVWLGLPILAHSGTNPWIYAFHHGEIRLAASKIAEDIINLFGLEPSNYLYGRCSPTRRRRVSRTNFELAGVNSCCSDQEEEVVEQNTSNRRRHHRYHHHHRHRCRQPVVDCFAASTKRQSAICTSNGKHCPNNLENSFLVNNNSINHNNNNNNYKNNSSRAEANVAGDFKYSEKIEKKDSSCSDSSQIVEGNIHDLTRMLDPDFVIQRNKRIIDYSNRSVDKIKNLKYLLDPTFTKIRHLGRLGTTNDRHLHKRVGSVKNFSPRYRVRCHRDRDVTDLSSKRHDCNCHRYYYYYNHCDTMSDPALNNNDNQKDIYHQQYTINPMNRSAFLYLDNEIGLTRSKTSVSDSNINESTIIIDDHFGREKLNFNDDRVRYSECNLFHNVDNDDYKNQNRHRSLILGAIKRFAESRHKRSFSWARSRQRFDSKNRKNSFASSLPTPEVEGNNYNTDFIPTQRPNSVNARQNRLTITTNRLANLIDERLPIDNNEFIRSEPPSPIKIDASLFSSLFISKTFDSKKKTKTKINDDPVTPPTSILLDIEDCCNNSSSSSSSSSSSNDSNSSSSNTIDNDSNLLFTDKNQRDYATFKELNGHQGSMISSIAFGSRRPSESKWSESSRSQEILPTKLTIDNQNHCQSCCCFFPSSYSVNNFRCYCDIKNNHRLSSSSCLNEQTFLYTDDAALSSSLRESFFSGPSLNDSEEITFATTSYEDVATDDEYDLEQTKNLQKTIVKRSTISLLTKNNNFYYYHNYNDCEKFVKSHRDLVFRSDVNRSWLKNNNMCCSNKNSRNRQLAPLAVPTPTEVCSPIFDTSVVVSSNNLNSESNGFEV